MKKHSAALAFAFTAAAALGLVAAPAFAQTYDHLRCYKVKDQKTFIRAVAELESFSGPLAGIENCEIKPKAKEFCVPVDKSGVVVEDGSDNPFPAQEHDFDRLCYKLKCPKEVLPDPTYQDQFASRTLEKLKPQILCTPAVKGGPPTTTTTTNTTTTTSTTTSTVPVLCPLVTGQYSLTQSALGALEIGGVGTVSIPLGGTIDLEFGIPDLSCLHDVYVPLGGFYLPPVCLGGGVSVSITQTGCGTGWADSDGGSDFDVFSFVDTSNTTGSCSSLASNPGCASGNDSDTRVDWSFGDTFTDTAAGSGLGNLHFAFPALARTYFNGAFCPKVYDPGTDFLLAQSPFTFSYTTAASSATFSDLDSDGCSQTGSAASSVSASGAPIDQTPGEVGLAATAGLGSEDAPYDTPASVTADYNYAYVLPPTGEICTAIGGLPISFPIPGTECVDGDLLWTNKCDATTTVEIEGKSFTVSDSVSGGSIELTENRDGTDDVLLTAPYDQLVLQRPDGKYYCAYSETLVGCDSSDATCDLDHDVVTDADGDLGACVDNADCASITATFCSGIPSFADQSFCTPGGVCRGSCKDEASFSPPAGQAGGIADLGVRIELQTVTDGTPCDGNDTVDGSKSLCLRAATGFAVTNFDDVDSVPACNISKSPSGSTAPCDEVTEPGGGLRDPSNKWEYYATDAVIDLPADIFGVILQFHHACD